MSSHGDTENQMASSRDEETPLLAGHRTESIEQTSGPNELGRPDDKNPEPKTRSWYLWRVFWVLVVALVLGVFLQGWINAGGDVDVGYC